jgi:hypothetical protein
MLSFDKGAVQTAPFWLFNTMPQLQGQRKQHIPLCVSTALR